MKKKKRHHFVWRKYLRKWAHDEKIFCLMDGRIFKSSLMGVGQERYFYKLKELTDEEILFLRLLIAKSDSPMLRELNEGWITLFNSIFSIRRALRGAGKSNDEVEYALDVAICNFEEEIQSRVEIDGVRYLDLLYKEDLSFFESDNELISFLYFFCLQYFRTQRIANNIHQAIGDFKGFNIGAMWAVLRFISATNVGWSLYVERDRHFPVLLRNETNTPFLTGDQPVINTHATGLELTEQPEDLEFYYPISPERAFLLTKNENYKSNRYISLEQAEVEAYNFSIINQSGKQVYGPNRSSLEQHIRKA